MGSLEAHKTNLKGVSEVGAPKDSRASAIGLIAALDAVDVVGPQMFERDCLGYSFDLWSRSFSAEAEIVQVTDSDILTDIADIRALPTRHPEVGEVDTDLLSAIAAIEDYVLKNRPTYQ